MVMAGEVKMEFMLNDLLIILFWWLHLIFIGLIFLPITNKIFSRFFDRGYLFSKIIRIVVTAYCVWLLSSLKIFPFSRTVIYAVITVAVLLIFFYFRQFAAWKDLIKEKKRLKKVFKI